MMPHTRYDDVDHLKAELEQERRYKETIEWSNAELERSISELSAYLDELDANSRAADDNEWKVRFDSQTAMNKQLKDQKDFLETELTEARRRLTTGSYPEAMNFNLEALNEPELLRLVKHLERMRNDVFSTLRDTEWKLDKESKEFHHFDEMRRAYKGDLKHANATIERLRLGHVLDPSGAVSPIYPQGYFSYMDSQGPPSSYNNMDSAGSNEMGVGGMGMDRGGMGMDRGGMGMGGGGMGMGGGGGMGMGMGSMGRSRGAKKGGGKSPTKGMDHESPTRSKSRGDKKSKKKEAPPAEEMPTYGGRRGSVPFLGSGSETETGTEADTVIERQSNAPSTGDTFTISISNQMSEDRMTRRRESMRNQDDS